jgi:hypothetical protein
MNTYRIARRGIRYNVVQELPDDATFEIGGFPSPHDAQMCLDDYLRRTGQTITERPPGPR